MKKIVPTDAVLIPGNAEWVFKGVIFDVYQWQQALFDGSMATFEALRRPDTVAVIGIDQGKILVLDDQQPTVRMVKFSGGRVEEADGSILGAAQRELLEETGYSFRNWRLVRVFQPEVKVEWFVHVFVAWDVMDRVESNRDPGERIAVKLLPFDEVKQLAVDDVGYVGRSRPLFEKVESCDDLLRLPAFQGREIDR